MSDAAAKVEVAPAADEMQDTFVSRTASCCCVTTFTTTVKEGLAKFDKSECCGLWSDRLDIVALRNVSQWRTHTDQAGACARSGYIKLQLAGSRDWIKNNFMPALFGGWRDAFKADAVLRAASRADRPPVPAFLATPEMAAEHSWKRKVGCCGGSGVLCTNCCCESVEQTVRVGPSDSLSIVRDKAHPLFCTRSIDLDGTNTGEIGFIAAVAPVGCCGVTNDKPDFGACACSCDEQVVFTLTTDSDNPLASNTEKGDSEVITQNVLGRVLTDPAVIPEQKLRSFVSQHVCYGRRGELVITNKRVEYVGYKHPPFLCEAVAPGVPNIFCALCQVHERLTIPLDKVTDTVVQADGPCKVAADYADSCRWALKQALEAGLSLNLVALVIWLLVFAFNLVLAILSPLAMLVCCLPLCRQTAVTIGAQARSGRIDVSLNTPADTGGLSMRDFAVDIINLVRSTQEENKAKLQRAAESGAAKL